MRHCSVWVVGEADQTEVRFGKHIGTTVHTALDFDTSEHNVRMRHCGGGGHTIK